MRITYSLLALTLIAGLSIIGCKKDGGNAGVPGKEVELFAQGQDLQKQEKFTEAVNLYRQISREYPKTKQGANSQFMVGYIYANHLKDYSQAKIELDRFIDKYDGTADSGLIAGARFELQYLGKSIDEIPILSNLEGAPPDTGKK